MSKDQTFLQRYTIADVFDRTIAMIGRTWKTSLGLGAVVFAVPAVVLGWAILRAVGGVARLVEQAGPDAGIEILWPVARQFSVLPLAGILVGLAFLVVQLSVMDAVRAQVLEGAHTSWGSLRRVMQVAFWPVIGQAILKGLLFGVLLTIPGGVVFLVVGVLEAGGLGVAIAVIIYLAAIVITLWLSIALFFNAQAVLFDKDGVISGLSHSMRLVRGNWWRVLGLSILIQLVISFAMGIISTPLVGVALLPTVNTLIDTASSPNMTDAEVVRMLSSFSGLGIAAILGTLVQQLVTVLVVPVYYTLVFVDLKVRAGELTPE